VTRFSRKTVLLASAGLLAVGTLSGVSAASAADNPQNPQAPSGGRSSAAAAAAPASCITLSQPTGSGGQHYRKLLNTPFTFTPASSGTGFFNIPCSKTTFTVPRGQKALVTLRATAEHDCSTTSPASNSWCEEAFFVNGKPALPDNSGRSDTYAVDNAKGGLYDWSAHSLAQDLAVSCPRSSTTTSPCVYTVQLKGRFQGSAANYWWYDDATVETDVTTGTVTMTTGAPSTP